MFNIQSGSLCESCFARINTEPCPECGFSTESYIPDPAVLRCGTVLQGRYIVGRVIGKGGFGITYLAYDAKLERKIALKEYFPYGLALRDPATMLLSVSNERDEETFRKGAGRFYDEARLVAKFNGNPNIVGVYDFFYENDTAYYTMEYLRGTTLNGYVEKNGVLTDGQAVFIAGEIANALMAAHSSSVLHRDISPDNIMLCDDGSVKLIDFGAARQVVAEGSQNLSVILKQGFAPIEQYQRKGKQGPWTDIYSLGTTLFYSLTKIIPDDPMSRMEDDSDMTAAAGGMDEGLWGVIKKCTMLNSADRYRNIFELKNDLNDLSLKPLHIIEPSEEPAVFAGTAKTFSERSAQGAPTAPVSVSGKSISASGGVSIRVEPIAPEKAEAAVSAPSGSNVSSDTEKAPRDKRPIIAAAVGSAAGVIGAAVLAIALLAGGAGENSSGGSDVISGSPGASGEESSLSERYTITLNINSEPTENISVTPDSESEQDPPESSSTASKPQPTTTTPKTTTTKPKTTTTKPRTTTTKPKTTTTKPRTTPAAPKTTTTKPQTTTTKPKTTTTTKPQPVEPELTSVVIAGESYPVDTERLDLSGKGLKDSDISNLKCMKNLRILYLNNNDLTDLSALSELTTLEDLDIRSNNVKDISFVKNLKNLKYLWADYNNITDLSAVKNLKKLTKLDVSDNIGITDISALSGLTQLEFLDIDRIDISDISLLKKCTKLRTLSFSYTKVSDISVLSNMPDLEYIGFRDCSVESIEALWDCPNINYAYMNGNRIDDLTPLTVSTGLQTLSASYNNINGNYEAIEGLTISGNEYYDTGELYLQGNGFTDEDEFREFAENNMYGEFEYEIG